MKTNIIISALILSLFAMTVKLEAQPQTKEEWQSNLQQAISQRDNLKNQVAVLEKEVTDLRQRDASLAAELKKSQDELYALLGRSEKQAKEFVQLLDQIDSRLNNLSKLSYVFLHAQSP